MDETEQTTLPARGGSMFPFVPGGSTLELRRAPPEDIRVGDIVCYPGQGHGMVAHRVVGIGDGEYRLRGDSQTGVEAVPAAAIAYLVTSVSFRGMRYDPRSPFGRLLATLAVRGGPAMAIARLFARGLNSLLHSLAHLGRRIT